MMRIFLIEKIIISRVRWRTRWPTSGKWSGSRAALSLSCSQGANHHLEDDGDDFDDNADNENNDNDDNDDNDDNENDDEDEYRLSENGYQLAHRYWPEEGSEQYHIFEVSFNIFVNIW